MFYITPYTVLFIYFIVWFNEGTVAFYHVLGTYEIFRGGTDIFEIIGAGLIEDALVVELFILIFIVGISCGGGLAYDIF